MKLKNHLVITSLCAVAAWIPFAHAQEATRHETRSGILEFEANGYPTDETVQRIREEVDYQRAVQAYIHFVPAVGIMQWRNAHFDNLGGKAGDLIVYGTTEQKMPILTANDTTTYVLTFAELSETGGLLMYEVPPGPTGGGVIDLWQRPVSDTGMVGPDRGKGGKFLIALEGTKIPDEPGAVKTGFDAVALEALDKLECPEDYRPLIKGFRDYIEKTYASCPGPEGTANAILQAIKAPRPKIRYTTTTDAALVPIARSVLGDRIFDSILLSKYGNYDTQSDGQTVK